MGAPKHVPYKLGSNDANTNGEITTWGKWFAKKYESYAAKPDGYYGYDEVRAVSEYQRRAELPVTGWFDEVTALKSGYLKPKAKTREAHRPIWMYSAPGSGADWWMGPPFDTGEFCKGAFNLNHQPVGYPKGGYLGLMGGDPGLSYIDVITAEAAELERLIDACPDLNDPNVEFWFFGYSQSADGIKRAVVKLYGDDGKYKQLRSRINGLVLFGDPSRCPGPTKVGNDPKGWGIARYDSPQWADDLTWSITTHFDMYACTTDDTLLPLFYEWFIKAETELPFVVYCASIVIPAITSYLGIVGPLLGGLFGAAGAAILSATTGVALPFLTQLISGYGGGSPNPELVKALSAQGLLTPQGIGKLIATLAALPGVQTHGEYHLPKPEFGGRTGIQVACDIVKDFRR